MFNARPALDVSEICSAQIDDEQQQLSSRNELSFFISTESVSAQRQTNIICCRHEFEPTWCSQPTPPPQTSQQHRAPILHVSSQLTAVRFLRGAEVRAGKYEMRVNNRRGNAEGGTHKSDDDDEEEEEALLHLTLFRLGSVSLKAVLEPAEAVRELLIHGLQRGNTLRQHNQRLEEENQRRRREQQRITAE
ncbi:hypothetical protein D9C73_018150 [Collichthys lucidus]|uniref:XRCC4 coiled-coil domain-containing protein n=1 Tax=Collichthys lucidus TaxID=240159 RepID=A0A4U5VBZ0_COLLU|nr:hypothetical protein D9C73_018150 [Collichthys lucidus]